MHIAAFLKNGAEYAISMYAAAILGCAFVPINATLAGKETEVQHMLGAAGVEGLIVGDEKMAGEITQAMGEELRRKMKVKVICEKAEPGNTSSTLEGWLSVSRTCSSNETAIPQQEQQQETSDQPSLTSTALIIFTSGTTSLPKPVPKSHLALTSSIRSHAQVQSLSPQRSFCDNLPSFHVYGIMWMLAFWSVGGMVCFPSENFEPDETLRAVKEEKLTNLAGVPSLMQAVIRAEEEGKEGGGGGLESLVSVAVAGSMVMPSMVEDIGRGLGVRKVSTSFGMSEASPITGIPFEELPYKFRGELVTAGKCSPGVRIRVCKPGSKEVVERCVAGELQIGGATVIEGYLGMEDKTEETFYEDEDGRKWFRSGDQAVMEENGEIFVQGRYKDLIIRGGENISPASIERVIDSLPEVATSQVVAVQDEVAGEVPLAVVKTAGDHPVSNDSVHDVVVDKLGTLYVPAETVTLSELGIDDFPKTDSGKVQKGKLKETVAEYLQARDGGDMNTASADSRESNVDNLHRIWSKLLSVSRDRLTTSTSIVDMADSITIMRSVNKIKHELGHTITTREVMENPTIEAQASLLQDRAQNTITSAPELASALREGPPTASDMVHTHGSSKRAQQTQAAFEQATSDMGLTWDDVEDVVPISDFMQVMLRRLRAQSWNHRHAWKSTASPKKLRSAFEKASTHNAMLRTMAVQPEGSPPLHYIVRPSKKWFDLVITEKEESVATADELRTLHLNDPELDFAAAPGPLLRAIIVPIQEGGSGLIYQAQHSCFDGLSMPNLREDLKSILQEGEEVDIPPRTSFKLYADTLYLHRDSVQAKIDIDFHAGRLQGLDDLEQSLWPVQRAPEWFKGDFSDVSPDLVKARPLLDGDESIGVDGVMKRIKLPHLQALTEKHSIPAPAILKTALALLNVSYTKQNEAVFTNYEAGLTWPFLEPWIAERLPNTMDINGPTLEAVLNIIPLQNRERGEEETCLAMMSRVSSEQTLLSQHSHAPLFSIQKALAENDGAKLIGTMRRQIFLAA
ncbi:putative AMP-dependent synthetase/ligase, Condensation domain, phosphopantetheine binding ACP [Septoria linicola]|nr:putative AMP-dependent synthetase/ligase, Condensation domain, phosphopantetheine binding ACP [Septoria linicola]